jgi:phosphatidylethanolamine/phosphatidyl-N-methylethanolamine N-methyltransferase
MPGSSLSVSTIDNRLVQRVYSNLASVYDWAFGSILQAGRIAAIREMGIRPGDTVLEVGVGTGINAPLYPRDCIVTGIDLSRSMLEQAFARVSACGIRHVRLLEMDAANLQFPDESFDVTYASYLMSAVADPVAVTLEMRRVCRKNGRIVLLNHFRSENAMVARAERFLSPLTIHAGFRSDLDLRALLAQTRLEPISIEKVNTPAIWSLVTCRKELTPSGSA